jgi:hypothetical protein
LLFYEMRTGMTTTMRFWCCNGRATKAIHVEVRAPEGANESKARLSAEAFAAQKLKNRNVWAIRIPRRGAAQFTITLQDEN